VRDPRDSFSASTMSVKRRSFDTSGSTEPGLALQPDEIGAKFFCTA
jgi:hypothetical protein